MAHASRIIPEFIRGTPEFNVSKLLSGRLLPSVPFSYRLPSFLD